MRLANGPKSKSFHAGRVEIYINGQWGTVCDDSWSYSDAQVVCKQLGYQNYLYYYSNAAFGAGTGPIWLSNLGCGGYERSLLDCSHSGIGIHHCSHYEDASVVCYNGNHNYMYICRDI